MTQNPSICKSMSEVWERKISVHTILASMLKMHGKSLDNESLLILMTEVEGILNSWPLAVEMINDPSSFQPLSLANILTIKSKVVMPPPGKFQRPDLYCRRQWRRVQHSQWVLVLPEEEVLTIICKSIRNGIPQEEIFLLVPLCYSKPKCFPKNWWSTKKEKANNIVEWPVIV